VINSDNIKETIRVFRSLYLQRFLDDIDTMTPEERSKRLGLSTSKELSDLLAETRNDPIDNIIRLVKTPRLLKMIFRRTIHSWERLHGEIDFDDLLIANVIRFAAPQGFDFLLENYREIRGLERESILKDRDKRKGSLQEKWDAAANGVSWETTAVEELIAFLFPMWIIKPFFGGGVIPQGVRNSIPTDYWLRLNIEELGQMEVRDQETLHAIVNWKKDANNVHFHGLSLSEALYVHKELNPKFEQFAQLFLNGQEFRKLGSSLFQIIIKEHGVKANADSCAGFISLWRLAIRRPVDDREHTDWILNEIRVVLPKSFRFANDLYYYWKSNSESDVNLKKPCQELRELIIQEAKLLFQDSAERFINSLDPDFIYSVFHFVVLYSSMDQGGPGFNPMDWRWFAYLLVDAAKLAPSIVIPQIVNLLFREERRTFDDFIYHFDNQMALQLFGDKFIDTMTLIAEPFDFSRFNERERNMIEFARQEASKLLKA